MFSPEERARRRDALVSRARGDERITGVALTGSAAVNREDDWSDIDLAFGVADGVPLAAVIADWTDHLYRVHGAVDHLDVAGGGTVYRVFLLVTSLQVDLAFSPAAEFGAIGPTFRLLHGTALPQPPASSPGALQLIGQGWLYALHARSSLARGRVWQAEYMISGVRDHVLALACVRHGLPASHGRGVDRLAPEVTDALTATLVASLDPPELRRAFGAATAGLLAEIAHVDAALAGRLAGPLGELSAGSRRPD